MADRVKVVLDKVSREPAFAKEVLRNPRVALASYKLTPEEIDRVVRIVSTGSAPPPP